MEIPPYLISYGSDWLNLLLRWLHIITGIAWIGASFYFVWLDNHIRAPKPDSPLAKLGVAGELWAVHGGGFYNPQKYLVAPQELPTELHWFKWEAYSTWLSGFALLSVVYYFQPQAMLLQSGVNLSGAAAIGLGLGSLVAAWLVYDLLCKSPLGQRPLLLGLTVYGLLVAASFGLSHWFSGRATFIHIGAMIGTAMVGNVFFVIIPGQRKLVQALSARQTPDPIHGQKAKQRSVHNNYFTLPVLLIMISNHYAMTYNHAQNYLILALLMAAGVLIRHFFNLRHQGKTQIGWPLAGVALLLLTAFMLAPAPAPSQTSSIGSPAAGNLAKSATASATAAPLTGNPASFVQIHAILERRCIACHAQHPSFAGFAAPPAGVMLETPAQIKQNAQRVVVQTVQTRAMPLGNLTKMTDEERAAIAAWFQAGAATAPNPN
jgi:uncharacterized membrane protein